MKNTQIVLASRPEGWVKKENFRTVETSLPDLAAGQILLKNLYLSLDPYMRGRMNATHSYAASVEIGQVMVGETVAEVVESRNESFKVGSTVAAYAGWQQYLISDGSNLRPVDPKLVPLSAYLGVVGMPGVTAWYGLLKIGEPKAGETVLVSAASGAVGGVVGQIAKLKGCHVIGIAGGPKKCEYVVKELSFDACIDHHAPDVAGALAAAAPKGFDVYFDNVGGPILDAVLLQCNPFSRIPICGQISDYNATERYGVRDLAAALWKRIKMQGFIISDHRDIWPEAQQQLAGWVRDGKIKYRESVTQGLENAPEAFIGLFKGENFGKVIVKLA